MIKLSDIKSNPNNPRLIKDEKFKKLVNSIKEFPKMMDLRPIIIDNDSMILGGNMRLKALLELKYSEVPNEWIKKAKDLTEEETKRFVIADNVGFGEHDWDILANEWDTEQLTEWGMDVWKGVGIEEGTDGFTLPSGEKAPFQQMTFTLADQQATEIKNAITDIKATDEYKFMETSGNENTNGNALSLIIQQWVELKK